LEFRRDLWDYHGEYQRSDMLKRIKSKNPKLKEIEKYRDTLKAKIVNNSFYKSIPSIGLQRDIRKGKVAILLSNSVESEEELKSLLMKVKQESYKSWLKTQHSEN